MILSLDSIPLEEIDEVYLRRTGEPFVFDGTAPDALAVTAVAAYWQGGASLSQALHLWFPLVAFRDDSPGWFDTRATKRRLELDSLERRRRLVDGMIFPSVPGRRPALPVRGHARQGGDRLFAKPFPGDTIGSQVR